MKKPGVKLWILSAVLMLIGVALSSSRAIELFGVRPDLFFAVAISAGFFTDSIVAYLALVIFGATLLRTSSGLNAPVLIAGLIVLLVFWAKRNILAPGPAANLVFITLATFIWHLAVSPAFLVANFGTFMIELFYNLISGAVIYAILFLIRHRLERRHT